MDCYKLYYLTWSHKMPLKQCNVDGKSGWKWGDSGHCYTGPEGKKKAIKQGIAIEGPEKFSKIQHSEGFTESEINLFHECLYEEGYSLRFINQMIYEKSLTL